MESCRTYEGLIDRVQAGEAGHEEREHLAAHLEECASCGDLFDLLDRLADEVGIDEPSELELEQMRTDVLAGLRSRRAPRRGRRPVGKWIALAASAAGVAFVAGWLGGGSRAAHLSEVVGEASDFASAPALVGQVRRAAVRHAALADVADSPLSYSDVQVRELDEERVRLGFLVSRHLDLELDRDDPLVAEVLVQAMTSSSSVGTRIEAIDVSSRALAPKVEQALVVAMLHDENLGVRLAAQARLAALPHDATIERAMLDVLVGDPEVQMRLAAIDYLTSNRVERERIEGALALGEHGDQPVVRARVARYASGRIPNP